VLRYSGGRNAKIEAASLARLTAVDEGGEVEPAVAAGVWLFRSAVDAGLPSPQRGDAADGVGELSWRPLKKKPSAA